MRFSLGLLVVGAGVTLGGAWLIGTWAVGLCLVAYGIGMVGLSLFRDDGKGPQAEVMQHPTPPGFQHPAFSEQESMDRIFEQQRVIP